MERDDLPTLRALGFADDDLRQLGLWEPATGDAVDLAEAYIRRSKKRDNVATLRAHVRDVCRTAANDGKAIRRVWFEQISASKAHVRREEFEKATAAVLEGHSKTLYVWKLDRLSRRGMGAVGLLLDEFDKRGARMGSVTEGLDSSQRGARMVIAFLSERAREEAADIALRTKAGGDANKAEGRWPGGVVPFGLRCPNGSGKLEHDPVEYPTARRIADALLAGDTPAMIAEALNSEGIKTRKGKQWRAQTIIHLAQSASWAGLIPDRERAKDGFGNPLDKWHRGGNPLMGTDGHPVQAGVGVVTFAEREKILAKFAARSRPGTTIGDRSRGKRKAATILTGILRCPFCKGAMGNGGRNYRCLARINQGPSVCKGIATLRERADEAAAVLWINHILGLSLESPTIWGIARRWLSYQDPEKEARKRAVTAALDNAVTRELKLQKEFFIGGGMVESTYEALRAELSSQIESLKAELAELSKEADLTPLIEPETLVDLWEAAGIDERRALLEAALKGITLLPPKYQGDKTPILDRLDPDWRDASVNPAVEAAWDAWEARRTQAAG
ncbi:recombinase family protein [Streptomyces europaeiscabiei]|uniref:Recombinase family protein n=1 Tax=Streptomyces europaeiscabiei TaxID=146819 RepID=A0AAJ2PUW4_9ACTN|nr:recombinase family protein [Streptomyces europaeiscabiei]MDX3133885.1 recombinase family protein [Streptomyces europaeiscabiei]